MFIHGMIDSNNGGTCVSMPVLYTAVARRLNYPVKLVLAKAHVFCRWDGSYRGGRHERVNVEATNDGMNAHPDSYYRRWPHPISEEEIDRGEYLRSLDPLEEVALCLATRGYCLEDTGKLDEAREVYAKAAELAPDCGAYQAHLAGVGRDLQGPARVRGLVNPSPATDLPRVGTFGQPLPDQRSLPSHMRLNRNNQPSVLNPRTGPAQER